MQSGFSEVIINDVITEKRVQSDLNSVINSLYNNKKIDINTKELKESLHNIIQKQIANHEIDEVTQDSINQFEESIVDEYKSNMYYSEDTVHSKGNYLPKTCRIVKYTMIGLAIFIIVLCVLLFLLSKPSIGVTFVISGVLCISVKLFSIIKLAINNILMLNWAFSLTLSQIMNNIVNQIFNTGIVLTVLGIFIIVFFEYDISKKMFTNNREKKE